MSQPDILNSRYQLSEVLGEGGFGAVFKAQDLILHRTVAVKRLHREISQIPEQADRFLAEARLTSQLSNPNILTLFDFGTDEDGQLFLVTEFLEGHSISDHLNEHGILSAEEVFRFFLPICNALQEAHLEGIIHRDLKPANIFISQHRGQERVKLLDFGIAKALEGMDVTMTGHFVGSPQYLSPEQAKGEKVLTPATDIYSLGITLYQCLVGVPPFMGDSLLDLLNAIAFQAPPELSTHTDDPVTLAFQPIISKMLEKDPKGRFHTAEELHDALLALRSSLIQKYGASQFSDQVLSLQSISVITPHIQAPTPKKFPWHVLGGALLLSVLVGIGIFYLQFDKSNVPVASNDQQAVIIGARDLSHKTNQSRPASKVERRTTSKSKSVKKSSSTKRPRSLRSTARSSLKASTSKSTAKNYRDERKRSTPEKLYTFSRSPEDSTLSINQRVTFTVMNKKTKEYDTPKIEIVKGKQAIKLIRENIIEVTQVIKGPIKVKSCFKRDCHSFTLNTLNTDI